MHENHTVVQMLFLKLCIQYIYSPLSFTGANLYVFNMKANGVSSGLALKSSCYLMQAHLSYLLFVDWIKCF